jgi:transposase
VQYARQPTKPEEQELERMTQQAVGRVALRAQIILLSARGFTVPDIADIQQTSEVTVYKWLNRFDAEGPAGLYDRPRSGRPPKVDQDTQQVIEEAVSEPPTEQGYNFTYWTVPLLSQHVRQTLDKQLCHETVRIALHALGFRWRRPRWATPREDPQAAQRMQAIARAVFKAQEGTVILLEEKPS